MPDHGGISYGFRLDAPVGTGWLVRAVITREGGGATGINQKVYQSVEGRPRDLLPLRRASRLPIGGSAKRARANRLTLRRLTKAIDVRNLAFRLARLTGGAFPHHREDPCLQVASQVIVILALPSPEEGLLDEIFSLRCRRRDRICKSSQFRQPSKKVVTKQVRVRCL